MTFNCHRGFALIYDSTSMPTSELNLEKPIGKKSVLELNYLKKIEK